MCSLEDIQEFLPVGHRDKKVIIPVKYNSDNILGKFIVGKWYKSNIADNETEWFYLKVTKIHADKLEGERIAHNKIYEPVAYWDVLKVLHQALHLGPLTNVTEIQKWLPDGHIDKNNLQFPSHGYCECIDESLIKYLSKKYNSTVRIPGWKPIGIAWNYNGWWYIRTESTKPTFTIEYLNQFIKPDVRNFRNDDVRLLLNTHAINLDPADLLGIEKILHENKFEFEIGKWYKGFKTIKYAKCAGSYVDNRFPATEYVCNDGGYINRTNIVRFILNNDINPSADIVECNSMDLLEINTYIRYNLKPELTLIDESYKRPHITNITQGNIIHDANERYRINSSGVLFYFDDVPYPELTTITKLHTYVERMKAYTTSKSEIDMTLKTLKK